MSLSQSSHRTLRELCGIVLLAAFAWLASAEHARAQVPSDPFNYSRTSEFTYYAESDGFKNGLLKTEKIEPGSPQLCLLTTYDYDEYGNKRSATTEHCAGASGMTLVEPRKSTQVSNDGRFANQSTNALDHSEGRQYDPRFGVLLSLTGPNNQETRWEIDDFGRKVREIRPDRTRTEIAYCWLEAPGRRLESNSELCRSLPKRYADPNFNGEVPPEAVMFVHTEPRDANNLKNGPFTRTYTDRLGRTIRTVTEGFDGGGQPSALRGALVSRDVAYGGWGQKVIETQPYFLTANGKGNHSATTTGSAHDYGISFTEYDDFGRPRFVHMADPNGSVPPIDYGSRGSHRSSKITYAYEGLKTTITNDKGQTRIEERNVEGKVVRVTDATGAQIAHQHDAFGNLIATKDALQNTITMTYDIRGRKVEMNDPDAGVTKYVYDALGQLRWQQTANQRALGQATTMSYDKLGRMTVRNEPEYVSTWTYDACPMGKGKLCTVNLSHGVHRQFVYDTQGRPSSTRTTVIGGGPSFATAVSYDSANGRVDKLTYPTGLAVRYGYTPLGYPEKVDLVQNATVAPLPGSPSAGGPLPARTLWTAQALSAAGVLEVQSTGGGTFTTTKLEAATGRIQTINAAGPGGNVQDQRYGWDALGNLLTRLDNIGDGNTGAVSETFTYDDALNRLTGYTVSAPAVPSLSRSVTMQYNALGMMLYKSDVGVYRYGAQGPGSVRPHALLGVTANTTTSYSHDANGNLTAASDGSYRSVAYTSFNLPDSQSGVAGPAGLPRYTWQYDENHQRLKETRVTQGGTRTTWSLHPDHQGGLAFEREEGPSGASNRHYITMAGRVIGVLVSTGSLPNLGDHQAPTPITVPPEPQSIALVKVEYWHTDHLGSLVATTDAAGRVTARYAYDPFGKRRYTNGRYDDFGTLVVDWSSSAASGTDRGYTGHEHLDDVGLVHMNGRIFDPRLGVMLQADPFIQDPSNLQNYNRYGYCFNGPLSCTDPSGYFLKWLARKWREEIWRRPIGRALVAIGVSALVGPGGGADLLFHVGTNTMSSAAIAGFAGGVVGTGSLKGGIQGAFSAVLFMGAGNLISGGTISAPGAAGAKEMGWAASVALHGVVGCVSSEASGGKCSEGAISAAFTKAVSGLIGPWTGGDKYAGAIAAAVVGGTAAELSGGKFANGAVTGGVFLPL